MAAVKYWCPIAIRSAIWALLFCTALAAHAEAPANDDALKLSAQLEQLEGYRHPFVQQIYNTAGQLIETSEGEVAVLRPNVRWEISTPFPQTILLLENVLKIYDPDLEQVTVRELEDSWSEVPLALLVNGTALSEFFSVTQVEKDVFVLHPLAEDSLLREVRMEWDQGALANIQIYDHTRQLILVQFEHQSIRQVIQSDSFELALPAGTEVVRG